MKLAYLRRKRSTCWVPLLEGGASDSEGIKCAFILVTLMELYLGLVTLAYEHLAVEAGSVGN
jgi:hypothetical protein